MDQENRKFVPQVLVVQTGTLVAFPNNDTVSHQVYSFSPARRFQLPLYKGEAHSPVTFDTAGLVVLGLQHPRRHGRLYLRDRLPYFAKTDADGNAEIPDVPAGRYRLDVWGPRVADSSETLVREVTLAVRTRSPPNGDCSAPFDRILRPDPGTSTGTIEMRCARAVAMVLRSVRARSPVTPATGSKCRASSTCG